MMPSLPGYDSWLQDAPEPPSWCDMNCSTCDHRFDCGCDWPFQDEDEEDEAKANGTYVQIVIDNGFEV